MADQLALGDAHQVVLVDGPDGWTISPCHADGSPCAPGDGAAEALISVVRQAGDLADRWQVLRLAAVPDVSGEKPIGVDQTNTSVVVGQRHQALPGVARREEAVFCAKASRAAARVHDLGANDL